MLFVAVKLTEPSKNQSTIRWHSFIKGIIDMITCGFVHPGGQYFDYELVPLYRPVSIQDPRPNIVGSQLILIFRSW